jgi:hypothetical protein
VTYIYVKACFVGKPLRAAMRGAFDRRYCVQHNNVYILAVTKRNSNVTMILTFMMQLVDVCTA